LIGKLVQAPVVVGFALKVSVRQPPGLSMKACPALYVMAAEAFGGPEKWEERMRPFRTVDNIPTGCTIMVQGRGLNLLPQH